MLVILSSAGTIRHEEATTGPHPDNSLLSLDGNSPDNQVAKGSPRFRQTHGPAFASLDQRERHSAHGLLLGWLFGGVLEVDSPEAVRPHFFTETRRGVLCKSAEIKWL